MSSRWYISLVVMIGALVGCERDLGTTPKMSEKVRVYPTTGFVDYDWLPEKLKHAMDHLVQMYPEQLYRFYYYFATDDINQHYYMVDPGLQIIVEMPVTNEEALRRIDDKLYSAKTQKRGLYVAHDTVDRHEEVRTSGPWPEHKLAVFYVLPEGGADFSQLRVAIVKDTISQQTARYFTSNDLTVYSINEVDVPPRPVRGMKYFREAVTNAIQSAEIFTLYDTNDTTTVEVEFTIWHTAQSPNIIRGFSSQEDTYEAYQADGEILKAIHFAKVWWHDAQKDGHPVRSKMRTIFDISDLKN